MNYRILGVVAVLLASVFLTGSALADTHEPSGGSFTIQNPLNCDDLKCVLENVIKVLGILAIPICSLMVVWGAYQMLTAGGDPEKFSTGKKTVLYAAIGLAVVILAQWVVPVVKQILGARN